MPSALKVLFGLSVLAAVFFCLISLTPIFEVSVGGVKFSSNNWWSYGLGWVVVTSALSSSVGFLCAVLRIKMAKLFLVLSWTVSGILLPLLLYMASRNQLLLVCSIFANSLAIIVLAAYLNKSTVVTTYFK